MKKRTSIYNKWHPVPEELALRLIADYRGGMRASECEKKYGFSSDAVLRKYGIERIKRDNDRPATGGKEKEIIAYYLAGNSYPRTAKHFGIGSTTVEQLMHRNGIATRKIGDLRPKSGGRDEEIISLYLGGLSAENVGKKIGLCEYTVAFVLRKNGIEMRSPGASGEKSPLWKGGVSKDKDYMNKWQRDYRRKKKENDPLYRLSCSLRARIGCFFKRSRTSFILGLEKVNTSTELLGCDMKTAFFHIEKQFRGGMTWENYGPAWHVDHRIPLASAKNEDDLRKLFHFTNLQPLFAKENQSKNAKLDWQLQEAA